MKCIQVTLPDGASKTDLLEASQRLRKSAETSALCRKLAAQCDALDCTQTELLSDDSSQFAMLDGDDSSQTHNGWSSGMIAGFVIGMAVIVLLVVVVVVMKCTKEETAEDIVYTQNDI